MNKDFDDGDDFSSMKDVSDQLRNHLSSLLELDVKPMDYAADYMQKLKTIKAYYYANMEKIIAHHKKYRVTLYESYPFEWSAIMTPVEWAAWECMKIKGRMPLYPQFPVVGYVLDFADPFLKIGVEIDGKDYHDTSKDLQRDKELSNAGWTIYRIRGAEMNKTRYEDWQDVEVLYDDDDNPYLSDEDTKKISHWIARTGDGVLEQ